jgi:hypothetical protein
MSATQMLIIRSIFASAYLFWGIMWSMVGYYYGRTSYVIWAAGGHRWRDAVPDILSPFTWAVRTTLCRWGLLRGEQVCGAQLSVPNPYESGALLRFAIFLSSLTPVYFGLFFFDLDRSDWTVQKMIATVICVTVSIVAAGGHLFLAYRNRAEAWRKLVMLSLMWVFFSPFFFYVFYYFIPTGVPWF